MSSCKSWSSHLRYVPMTRLCSYLLAICLFSACGAPPTTNYPTTPPKGVGDATLGVGDVFHVRVFRQEEMSGEYSVSSEGTISFPLIGAIPAAGKSPAGLEREIRDALAAGYLKNPQVSVIVKDFKSKKISVFGQVKKPGTLSYSDGMTVVEAISMAGGFTNMARKNEVNVTRKHGKKTTKYTLPIERIGQGKAGNFYVSPGDVVFVPRRWW